MDADSLFDPKAEPRRQHYFFAHIALPSLFFKSPTDFIQLMDTAGIRFLENLWNRLASEDVEGVPISSRGLKLDISRLMSDVICSVITLPVPRSIAEAHFVAAVHRPASSQNPVLKYGLARYFTLELGADINGIKRTVLCEWDKNRTHTNMGTGPDPTLNAFIERIIEIIKD